MSTDTIPSRTNGQTIDQLWFNILRTVLSGAVVGRVNGVATTGQALGSAVYRWGNMSLEANIDLYSTAGTLLYRFTQDSGDYLIQNGSGTEIARLTSTGWDARSILGRNKDGDTNIGSAYPETKDVHFPVNAAALGITSQTYTDSADNILYTKLNVDAPVGGTACIYVTLMGDGSNASYIQWKSAGGGLSSDPRLLFHFTSTSSGNTFANYVFGGITDQYYQPSSFNTLAVAASGDIDIYVSLTNLREDTIDFERIRLAAYQL